MTKRLVPLDGSVFAARQRSDAKASAREPVRRLLDVVDDGRRLRHEVVKAYGTAAWMQSKVDRLASPDNRHSVAFAGLRLLKSQLSFNSRSRASS